MLENFPRLREVVEVLDQFLREEHPSYFGPEAVHPYKRLKASKVIHDHLWGTVRFSWRELVLIDCPLLQRLRRIHQTGLAYYVYPSAQHSRFEHTLGVMTVASKVFDSIRQNSRSDLNSIVRITCDHMGTDLAIATLQQELRLAALLHDVGHSLHSHASERVYSEISLLKEAAEELRSLTGTKKGEGEVLSFCFALAPCLQELFKRASEKVGNDEPGEPIGALNWTNVALLIVGRSRHPYLQFMGDIISSGLDADKLDYLLRDAGAAGLPTRYDLERYLHTVYLGKDVIADEENHLRDMYHAVGEAPTRQEAGPTSGYEHYDAYRLALPRSAMNTIEQIIICKIMLFSYIYHHSKVVAAEGLLVRLLRMRVSQWKNDGASETDLLKKFMRMTDTALDGPDFVDSENSEISDYSYRVQNRLLPRERFALTGDTHADGDLIRRYLENFQDKELKRPQIEQLENLIGQKLIEINAGFGSTLDDALRKTGIWVDVPKTPTVEGVHIVITRGERAIEMKKIFPVDKWIEAYQAYRYFVRIYSFSEYESEANRACLSALKEVTHVTNDTVFLRLTKTGSA